MHKTMQGWLPDVGAAGPKYLAIAGALARDIEGGRLKSGDRLPPQRELAHALGVDLTTVTRAYGEARRLGLIDADGRRGSFVRAIKQHLPTGDEAPAHDTGMNLPPLPASLGERLAEGMRSLVTGSDGAFRLQYQPGGGAAADREAGASWLAERGIEASEDTVLLVSGGQTALHAIATAVLKPGEAVCTGAFVYPGWLSLARRSGLKIVDIESDEQGLDPAAVERACQMQGVRAIYVVPTNDNPTTVTTSQERREALVAVARRHNLKIIEDDAYGLLPATPLPPIAALAPERTWHVASLSKIISPALRVAYLRAPSVGEAWRLAAHVHDTTIMAPPLNAGLATCWLRDGSWSNLVAEVRAEAQARQVIAAAALPAGSYLAHPQGYHIWVPLPQGFAPAELAGALRPAGLSVVSGEAFAASSPQSSQAARISIGGGISRERLARALTLLEALLQDHQGGARPLV